MTRTAIGILAHVDAGKTTLCEGLMFLTGQIRSRGRVDHGDAHLDTHALEKQRGITIFSKQAHIVSGKLDAVLIDTPGHVDFSTEAERTLGVLDAAVLLISGTDGVQPHTLTLWRLLRRYRVPTFIFVNKMDIAERSPEALMKELSRELSPACALFCEGEVQCDETRDENAALADEELFESYSANGKLTDEEIRGAVREEKLFPCFFGSALHLTGVKEFIEGLERYTPTPVFGESFGARVFKISRDEQGTRLTHMRITGGTLLPRMTVSHTDRSGETKNEKIAQIRFYSGEKYEQLKEASAGDVVAAAGLACTYPGEGLGAEAEKAETSAILSPVLSYRIVLPEGADRQTVYKKLLEFSEEDPSLNIEWDPHLREIRARLMGEVQIEILKSLILERFGLEVGIDSGRVLYKETIAAPVEGVGHYEPLRHYAEVHLLLSPLKRGAGVEFDSLVSRNDLDVNWQRLILTHIAEKTHLGVLTGSPITDIRISLIAGKAHLAHTEGGDFRQATYRAIRQGLMKAQNILLEPYYSYRIEVPREQLGRIIGDIRSMGGSFSIQDDAAENASVRGFAPVAGMRGYAAKLAACTGGRGRLFAEVSHYDKCSNADEIIAESGYDPLRDLDNSPDSIFCAHGAGFQVRWNEVENYMHIDTGLRLGKTDGETPEEITPRTIRRNLDVDEKELEDIMLREFGPIKRPDYGRTQSAQEPERQIEPRPAKKDYLIVDGYNILFAWDCLRELAKSDIAAARHRLMDILVNYCAFRKNEVFLIFDGYRVKGNAGERFVYHGIRVAYTKENETADMLIERVINEIGKNYSVRVASSDGMIQLSSVRTGALRVTARELEHEVETANEQLHEIMEKLKKNETSVKIDLSGANAPDDGDDGDNGDH